MYDKGTTVSLAASPAAGYAFASWSGGASGTGSTVSVTANSDLNIVANFTAATYKLNAAGMTGGSVSISTPSVGTSSDGYPLFTAGTKVSVVATASPGYVFGGWDGPNGSSVSGGTTGTITMNGDMAIIGVFNTAPTYALTVALSDPSAGTPNGSATGLLAGATQPVSVTLNSGWMITGATITGTGATLSGSGSQNARSVTMGTADATVTYSVAQQAAYSLTVAVNNASGGAPNGSSSGLSAGATSPVSVNLNSGWTISSVSIAGPGASISGTGSDNARTVTMGSGNATVTYNLVQAPAATYSLIVQVSDSSGGTPVGSTTGLSTGQTSPVSVSLTSGWTVSSVSISGGGATISGSGSDNARTVTMGTADATVTYNLAPPAQYTVTATAGTGGTVTGGGTYASGDVATLTATPASGYSFSGWSGTNGGEMSGGTPGPSSTSGTILVNGNKSVQANFAQKTATASWSAQISGGSGAVATASINFYAQSGAQVAGVSQANVTYSPSTGTTISTPLLSFPIGTYTVIAKVTDSTGATQQVTGTLNVTSN